MRLYQTTDYQRIARMDSELFPDDYPVVDWDSAVWFIGISNGQDVCYCGIKLYEEMAYLNRAGVMPVARGKGYQKKMINKRVTFAKEQGIPCVVTDTVASNIPSNNNLIKTGFKMYDPGLYGWKEYGPSLVYWRLNI